MEFWIFGEEKESNTIRGWNYDPSPTVKDTLHVVEYSALEVEQAKLEDIERHHKKMIVGMAEKIQEMNAKLEVAMEALKRVPLGRCHNVEFYDGYDANCYDKCPACDVIEAIAKLEEQSGDT